MYKVTIWKQLEEYHQREYHFYVKTLNEALKYKQDNNISVEIEIVHNQIACLIGLVMYNFMKKEYEEDCRIFH